MEGMDQAVRAAASVVRALTRRPAQEEAERVEGATQLGVMARAPPHHHLHGKTRHQVSWPVPVAAVEVAVLQLTTTAAMAHCMVAAVEGEKALLGLAHKESLLSPITYRRDR